LKFQLKPWLLAVALVASLYGLILWWAEGASGQAVWLAVPPWIIVLVAGLCSLNYVLRGWRWQRWMLLYQRPLPALQALRFYVAGFVFTPTPGNVGEAVRGLLPRRQPLSLSESWSIYTAERVADMLALAVLAALALPALGSSWPNVWKLSALIVLLVLLLVPYVWRWFVRPDPLSRTLQHVQQLLQQARRCLSSSLPGWSSLTLAAWASQGVALWVLCRYIGLQLDAAACMGFYALAMIGGALSMMPAGLGGMELILTSLLVSQGAEMGLAAQVTILMRLLSLWLAVLLGGLCLLSSTMIQRDLSLS
jgi:uncharacterized membrane protein YbhN (UPF0104 family)